LVSNPISTTESGETPKGISLLTVLMILPLPFLRPDNEEVKEVDVKVCDHTHEEDNASVIRLLEFRQRHSMFLELCRLVTVAASQVSADVIHSTILPAINKFFTKFVHTYCDLDVRCDLMAMAFEIGRALYIPLVQLVGADSFSTAVPEVNPRLEVWLLHNSSCLDSDTRISELNALPDTIFPITMSKQDFVPEVEPEKEKGIWQGLGPFMPEWLAPSPERKPKADKKTSVTIGKEAEARLNQQMDDAMRDAIAQQEVQRELVQTPKKKKQHVSVDSDDDSIDQEVTSQDRKLSLTPISRATESDDDNSKVRLRPKGSTSMRNKQTKSIMHYHGDNSFYHALNSFNMDMYTPLHSDKVYFKQGYTPVSLSLVSASGKLVNKTPVATSFHPSPSISRTKSSDDNVMGSFKKVLKATIQRTPSKSDSPLPFGSEYDDDEESASVARQWSESVWLVGGTGRWVTGANDSEESDIAPPASPRPIVSLNAPTVPIPVPNMTIALNSPMKKKAPANISMATPKVLTDVATEAGAVFALNMINESSWAFDALAYKAYAAGAINVLLADPTERFLVAGAKDGEMKVFSLMSNPVVEVMKYSAHQAGVYSADFLKSGTHVASCDGTIRIWDIQTGMTIVDLQRSHSELDVFTHLQVVSPRTGVGSDMNKHGDDQLVTCAGAVLAHYDIRVGYMCSLNPISEWKLFTRFSNGNPNDIVNMFSLTCSTSNEDYVCIGSTNGTLWAYERRTGRPIHCWMGHEGSPILKIHYVDRHHIISVTERNAFCWNLGEDEPKKVYQVKGLPDCSAVMNANSIYMQTFDDPNSTVNSYQDVGSGQKKVNVLYCLAGHKICAGEVNTTGSRELRSTSGVKEAIDPPDIRLSKSFFNDIYHSKLTKQRMQISSACMLPLRRLLLLGTSDGLVRVVS